MPYLARSGNGAHSAYALTAFKVVVTVAACCFATSSSCLPAALNAATKCRSSNYIKKEALKKKKEITFIEDKDQGIQCIIKAKFQAKNG